MERAKMKTTLENANKKTEDKLNKLAVIADVTHKLSNNHMSIQLELAASALRRVANLTKAKEDEDLALRAEEKYRMHERNQAIVDSEHPKGIPDAV